MPLITDLTGQFRVTINPGQFGGAGGVLFDPLLGVGFQRVAGNFDPLRPGTQRECWGLSADGVAGFVDYTFTGTAPNTTPNGAGVFNPNDAFVSSFMGSGGNLLRLDQLFTFVAPNVLRIRHLIVNVSSVSRTIRFRRTIDWDVDIPGFNDTETFPPNPPGPPVATTFGSTPFDSASPLVPLGIIVVPPFVYNNEDLGCVVNFEFGVLAPGASVQFDYYYALSFQFQTENQLKAQLTALGFLYHITTRGASQTPDSVPAFNRGVCAVTFFTGASSQPCCPCAGSSGVAAPCCTDTDEGEAGRVSLTLTATVLSTTGACACRAGDLFTLSYDPLNQWWSGSISTLCNGAVTVMTARVRCAAGSCVALGLFDWCIELICGGTTYSSRVEGATTCNPFSIDSQPDLGAVLLCCNAPGPPASVVIRITE